jgi:hypothetical protein
VPGYFRISCQETPFQRKDVGRLINVLRAEVDSIIPVKYWMMS